MTSAFFDYDNDGHLDIMVTNGHLDDNVKDYDPSTAYEQLNQLFRNNGDGTFTETTAESGPGMQVKRVSGPRRATGGPKWPAAGPRTGQEARQHGPQEAKPLIKMKVLRPGRKVHLSKGHLGQMQSKSLRRS